MSTISASTTSTTAFKVTSDTTGTLVFQTGASPTTAMSISSSQIISFTNPPTATGGGSVSSNTAYGTSALFSNTTGDNNTGIGNEASYSNSTGVNNVAVGSLALRANTASQNVAVGVAAMYANTTGTGNTAVGSAANYASMRYNTTGSYNVAVGAGALAFNTVSNLNTAIGYQAAYSFNRNDIYGRNVAIGYQALYSATTSNENIAIGVQAGYSSSTNGQNVFIGEETGFSTTGGSSTFVGYAAGSSITTGAKNTIIGRYNGNQGGLDIRTASNKVVLSDGDGNVVFAYGAYPTGGGLSTSGGYAMLGLGGTGSTGTGALFLNGESSAGWGGVVAFCSNSAAAWGGIGRKGWFDGGSDNYLMCRNGSGGVYLNGASATSWTAASDERLKENLVDITDAASKVATLRAVVGNYTFDEDKVRKPFLIAQDIQAVLPEAVSSSRQIKGDETEYLGVAYTEVIPLLVAAIKELKAEIDTLKGQA